jgi:polyisoprenoid-binding protein YceI
MNVRRVVIGLGCALFLLAGASLVRADTYKVDPVHSTAIFRIQHGGVSYFYGRINGPQGTIEVDESDPTKTTFQIELKTANIDTNNPARDKHLKTPDFFSAEEFPTISFKSTSVKTSADNKLEVAGDLTMHGQTKPITMTVEHVGTADVPRMGHRTGYDASFTIKRSDFGMTKFLDLLGDEVRVRVGLEAAKQ